MLPVIVGFDGTHPAVLRQTCGNLYIIIKHNKLIIFDNVCYKF